VPVTKKMTYWPDANCMGFVESPSDYVDTVQLSSGVFKTFVKPSGARFVRLSAGALFYYRIDGAASQGADKTDGSGSISVPSTVQPMFCVDGTSSISVIAPSACTVSAEWWA
jgi:hypothetical protein